ncbi:MAG: HAMP domain-containing sensor histidine kinase [Finegoldia sp.]|nr:HAMP domain-containing sensor histidine kinase [Finegoldia sp.]
MELRSELHSQLLKAIIIPLTILSILPVFLFHINFKEFVNKEQKTDREKMETVTGRILAYKLLNDPDNKVRLNDIIPYINQFDLDIVLYNAKDEVVYAYQTGKDVARTSENYTIKTKNVYNNYNKIGHIEYIYPKTTGFSYRSQTFVAAVLRSFILSLILAYLSSLITSNLLANQLTDDIMAINKSAKEIIKGNYETKDLNSDILEMKALSNNINQIAKNLAVESDKRKEYAQNISHELRTPITNLRVNLELLEAGIVDPDEEYVGMLMEEIDRLTSLIAELNQTFNEFEDNRVEKSTFSLSELVEGIEKSFKPRFDNEDVSLDYKADEDLKIYTDREKLTTIITNLLSNALKACSAGDSVTIETSHVNDRVMISVSDTGIGIKEEDKVNIYERFFRVDDCRNTKENGYGLGLSIVKNYSDMLGATISINSKLNFGSKFTLFFDDDIIV